MSRSGAASRPSTRCARRTRIRRSPTAARSFPSVASSSSPRRTEMEQGTILLVSCYELGHQPLALASPLAFLERAGHAAEALDISVEPLEPSRFARARLVAISVPMHTALRLGVRVAEQIRRVNPRCHICFYGLYASLNAEYLLEHCGDSVIGGEYESA